MIDMSGLKYALVAAAGIAVVSTGVAVTSPWWAEDDISVDIEDKTKDLARLGRLDGTDYCAEFNKILVSYNAALENEAEGNPLPAVTVTCTPK